MDYLKNLRLQIVFGAQIGVQFLRGLRLLLAQLLAGSFVAQLQVERFEARLRVIVLDVPQTEHLFGDGQHFFGCLHLDLEGGQLLFLLLADLRLFEEQHFGLSEDVVVVIR